MALGEALGRSCAITTPEAIFLFGGLAKSGDIILNPQQKKYGRKPIKNVERKS